MEDPKISVLMIKIMFRTSSEAKKATQLCNINNKELQDRPAWSVEDQIVPVWPRETHNRSNSVNRFSYLTKM